MSKPIKRAITLAGGGPACGLHIGVLERLRQDGIEFDIWGLSCIGAWVGTVYNQWADGDPVEQTYKFFRDGIFRDDDGYARFPINTVFGPDLKGNTEAVMRFMRDLKSKLAREVNRLTGWRGTVFDRRYESAVVTDEDGAQIERLLYILSNSVKGGLVDRPQDWPWSSYRVTVGLAPAFPFVDARQVLGLFDVPLEFAVAQLRRYVEEP